MLSINLSFYFLRNQKLVDIQEISIIYLHFTIARRVARNESSIRRLFTSHQARPEFPLLATIAEVLGAQLAVVPVTPEAKRAVKKRGGKEQLIAA